MLLLIVGQTLSRIPSAADPTGQAGRLLSEEALWASHLAMRAAGAPASISRRALCRAVHVSPASVRSWARLGMLVVDTAVRPVSENVPENAATHKGERY